MKIKILSSLSIISALFAIYFSAWGYTDFYAIAKPLTTILILLLGVSIYQKKKTKYSLVLIVGLVLSLIGDVFLLGDGYFIQGLVSFLFAHLVFTYAFSSLFGFYKKLGPLFILLLVGGLYYYFISASLGALLIPVAVYVLVILTMNWQAIGLAFQNNATVFKYIAFAALLFAFSDAVLAYNKFVDPIKVADILILSSYWSAIFIFTICGLKIEKNMPINSGSK